MQPLEVFDRSEPDEWRFFKCKSLSMIEDQKTLILHRRLFGNQSAAAAAAFRETGRPCRQPLALQTTAERHPFSRDLSQLESRGLHRDTSPERRWNLPKHQRTIVFPGSFCTTVHSGVRKAEIRDTVSLVLCPILLLCVSSFRRRLDKRPLPKSLK